MAGMSLGTLFSRLTGFVKWAMLGAALGFTPLADAYNLAHILPTMIYELVLGGIFSAVLVPVVVETLAQGQSDQAWRTVSKVVNAGILVLLAVTLFCLAAAPWLVDLQTVKIGRADRRLVLFFFVFFVPQIFFYGLSALGNGLLNARHRFAIAAFAPVFNNLTVIASLGLYMLWPGFGNRGLALGTTAGVLIQALVLWPSLRASGFRYFAELDFRDPAVAKIVKLSGPVILYVVFNQINLTVQNNLAIPLTGGVSALQYAFAFYMLPHGLLAVSIGTVLLPKMSELAVARDWTSFAGKVEQGIRWSAVAILPAMALYLTLGRPLVEVLMQRGRFGATDTRLLAQVLSAYSLGLLSFTIYLFLNRAFYSLQDTRTPLALNFTGNLTNSVFNLLVVSRLGVPGLALGHALAYTVIAALSLALIKRRMASVNMSRTLWAVARAGGWGLAVAWFWSWYGGGLSLWPKAGILGAALLLAVPLYMAAARWMALEEIGPLWNLAKRRRPRKISL